MGRLVGGTWETSPVAPGAADGSFQRAESSWRNWITPDGRPGPTGLGGFAAESGRYHLYVSLACPWAHRTLIFRALKGLAAHISVDVVHPVMDPDGWAFGTDFPGATGDRVLGKDFLREIYLADDPEATTKVTVPVLWDKAAGRIVSNESSEIIRMLNSAFDGLTGSDLDLWPEPLRPEIDAINARVYPGLNNGVYRAGFARSQAAYDAAVADVFATLDWMEARLFEARWLAGDRQTEADWRAATTLFRFDPVYHTHFKCNRRQIVQYPRVWDYARRLYQTPGVAGTVDFAHIAHHYYRSHPDVNPFGIVPVGPEIDWTAPVAG
ncbi:MAG: glutathione S-transferase family protein [Amaricoccus sp.]|uniref:glutathione S-transferase family protein n=1 Tax=Amaricoccus sp. TaxID=1872485 RepID=UPI0039E2857C